MKLFEVRPVVFPFKEEGFPRKSLCSCVVVLPLYLLKFIHSYIEFFPTLPTLYLLSKSYRFLVWSIFNGTVFASSNPTAPFHTTNPNRTKKTKCTSSATPSNDAVSNTKRLLSLVVVLINRFEAAHGHVRQSLGSLAMGFWVDRRESVLLYLAMGIWAWSWLFWFGAWCLWPRVSRFGVD